VSTAEVLDHHLAAFGAADVDQIMSDYADDAVFCTPDGPVRGAAAIRETFRRIFADVFPRAGSTLEMRQRSLEGEVAYIVWSAETPTARVPVGTDTFVMRNGKILVHTFAAHFMPKP
jgi:ketosteroid isomerase-like protein